MTSVAREDVDDARQLAVSSPLRPVANFRRKRCERGEDSKVVAVPLPMVEVVQHILSEPVSGGWPRRVGSSIFIHDTDKSDVDFLTTPAALFGWLQTRTGRIHWKVGNAKEGCFVSKAETFAELQRQAKIYDGIEGLPHHPPIIGRYYISSITEPTDGSKLRELVGMFSPATDLDGELILALFLTPFWGGRSGAAPMGCITSDDGRGAGKSTLAMAIANIAGGSVDVSPNEDIQRLKERLLTPTSLRKRIVLLDNLKALKFSWGEFEGLLTSPQISGRQLYVGDASRPNNLTWIATLNGANFSEDIAQRAILIKIERSDYRPTFADDVNRFVDQHRERIVSDAIGILAGPKKTLTHFSRWNEWEMDVLACVDHPEQCQTLIAERQGAASVDREEAEIIENYAADRLAELHYDPPTASVRIPSAIMLRWYCDATNERISAVKASRIIGQMIDEGKLQNIRREPSRNYGRCWLWFGNESGSGDAIANDVESRLHHLATTSKGGGRCDY